MRLGTRKLVVLGLVAAVFLVANALVVADWLQEKGIIDFATGIRKDFLTGTAITIIVVLLILLVRPRGESGISAKRWTHRRFGCGNGGSPPLFPPGPYGKGDRSSRSILDAGAGPCGRVPCRPHHGAARGGREIPYTSAGI